MAKASFLSVFLCLLAFSHCSSARRPGQSQHQRQYGGQQQGECQINRLNAQEPQHRIQAEAGVTELWDRNDDQFQCAGVAACRNIIQQRGLVLPYYTNAPMLVYIVQGRGISGVMIPGCPETYQSSQGGSQESEEGRGQRGSDQDQHQKITHFRKGDVIALPAGVAHWCYNDGDEELVTVAMEDTGNSHNQLDDNPRKFFLAGNPQGQGGQQQREMQGRKGGQQQQNAGNVFSGFDTQVLAETFGVDTETARKLQGQDDSRGHIIRVESGLQVIRPQQSREEQEQQERGGRRDSNGMEETMCTARLKENIDDPSRADIFNPRAGRLTSINKFNLPILNFLRLSAEKGVLYRNAMMPPHYKMNAHCVLYATRGEARMQVVDQRGQAVFDDNIREGQLVVVPQNFVVMKQAGNQGFEWVAFRTSENAMFSTLAGRTSAMRAMPVDVLTNAYGISRDEARRLKFNRQETIMFEPSSRSRRRDIVA